MRSYYFLFIITVLAAAMTLKAQSGGPYDLSHNVVASGGGSGSTGGGFRLDGTVGQNMAGAVSSGGTFSLRGGFWAFQQSAPTAATVAVSGKVTTATGLGIRSVTVTLSAPDGSIRTTQTGTFGWFRFQDVAAGLTYIVSIVSKRYTFTESTRLISVNDNIADVNFVAQP
jgi:hypothetical protein